MINDQTVKFPSIIVWTHLKMAQGPKKVGHMIIYWLKDWLHYMVLWIQFFQQLNSLNLYCEYNNILFEYYTCQNSTIWVKWICNHSSTHFTMLIAWELSDWDLPRLLLVSEPRSRRPCFNWAKRSCKRRWSGCTPDGANCPCRCNPLSRTWIYKTSYQDKVQNYWGITIKIQLSTALLIWRKLYESFKWVVKFQQTEKAKKNYTST
jgi:hypothetical protein